MIISFFCSVWKHLNNPLEQYNQTASIPNYIEQKYFWYDEIYHFIQKESINKKMSHVIN